MQAEKWHQAIEAATLRHRRATPDLIIESARELFPEDMALEEAPAIMRGLKKQLRDAQRAASDMDEPGTGKQLSLPLPGKPMPKYLSVARGDGLSDVMLSLNTTHAERDAAIAERERIGKAITASALDLRAKQDFIAPFLGGETEILGDTLARIEQAKAAA